MKLTYYIAFFFWYLLSLLPLRVLYVLSDVLYFPLYHLLRYRRRVVRQNLTASFPEQTQREIVRMEKEFYAWFCDYVVETLKLMTMGKEETRRRMTFGGVDRIVEDMDRTGKNFAFVYLGHYGNWEWIA